MGDFHWYRWDKLGNVNIWSHKPGEAIPTVCDNAGNVITDPRKTAMGHYKFVSIMYSDKKKVNIQTNNPCM